MSHLCTMHHPPLSCERTGGDHFWGGRNSWRVATAPFHPFEAPTTPQPVPPSTLRWQWDDFEESTFKLHSPTFSQRRRSSARIAPQVYVGEARIWWPIFRSACGRAVRIRSLTRKRCICYNSCLLGRWSKASQYPLISERLHTQVI